MSLGLLSYGNGLVASICRITRSASDCASVIVQDVTQCQAVKTGNRLIDCGYVIAGSNGFAITYRKKPSGETVTVCGRDRVDYARPTLLETSCTGQGANAPTSLPEAA